MSRRPAVQTPRRAQAQQKTKMVKTKNSIDKRPDRKITDFFQARRSNRRTAHQLKMEMTKQTVELIETGYNEDYLRIFECELKGRGVRAGRPFAKDQFVVEYKGDMLPYAAARAREVAYAQDPKIGCYMYFFEYQNKRYCVDATAETQFKGRLVNHSLLNPNLKSKVVETSNGSIHLCLFAKRDIHMGEGAALRLRRSIECEHRLQSVAQILIAVR
ncbi:[Histone H4]-lysine(20) N-methyltransferase [Aphelenchoides fujianensis]|nr:[Histone H4]-lysine(20) N-methyltransferase [Aphelenchoides fujianensis]